MEDKILKIMKSVFQTDDIDKTSSQQNSEKWDSMNHLNLVVELEMEFGVSFEPEEIAKMRADQMKEAVNLTADQYAKVTVIFKEEMEAMQKMFEGGGMNGDFEQMRKDMEKRQEEQNKKLKAILTEDQFKKWQKQQEEMRAQFGGGF